jgi:aryl-phospho-beta-D-glucosidase BglC (GH1 family)
MSSPNQITGKTRIANGFVHTDGKFILDGEDNRITFRGTNLGGWLQQEGWMSPLGGGGINKNYFGSVSASSQYGNNSADLAIEEVDNNGIITGNLNTYWQSGDIQGNKNIEFKIAFNRGRTFSSIILETGPINTTEYLRGCFLQVSDDNVTWHGVTNITIDESKSADGIIKISFGEQTARYISIKPENTGPDAVYWTIADLNVCVSDEFTIRNNLIRRFGEAGANQLYAAFQNNWITDQDIQNIAAMNMNFVRVPVYWMDFALSDGTIRTDAASGFQKLDWVISQCSANNIYVLIDMHGAPGGANGWASSGQAGPIPTELFAGNSNVVAWNRQLLINIWEEIAARYKDNTTVGAYGLLNEPVLGFPETTNQLDLKYGLLDNLYNAVRAIDENHIVVFEEFGDWNIAENRPERAGWENYMFEKHPYDMDNGNNWWSQQNLVNTQVSTLSAVQNSWDIPLLVGEFCLYSFVDLWDSFLSQLNQNSISWCNWTYKVSGTMFESGGGNWGYYNTFTGNTPDILHDSFNAILRNWTDVATISRFATNSGFINAVSKRADGSVSPNIEILDISESTATASNYSPCPEDDIQNIFDGSSETRWATGVPQTAGMWLQVDLGGQMEFDIINLDAGNWTDYPKRYKVSVSKDGVNFSDIDINTSDIGFGQKIVIVASETQNVQHIKISLLDGKPDWWSVAIFQLMKRVDV